MGVATAINSFKFKHLWEKDVIASAFFIREQITLYSPSVYIVRFFYGVGMGTQ